MKAGVWIVCVSVNYSQALRVEPGDAERRRQCVPTQSVGTRISKGYVRSNNPFTAAKTVSTDRSRMQR
jgi:hypothetical protein